MDDTKKEVLLKQLRHLVEVSATVMHRVAIGDEQEAAAMLGVAAMYLSDAIGTMTGDREAERTIHLEAHKALDTAFPERGVKGVLS